MLAGNLDTGDVVADLHRQIEMRFGLVVAGVKRECGIAKGETFKIDRARIAGGFGARIGPQHFHGQRARRIVWGNKRSWPGYSASHDRNRMAAKGLGQVLGEIRAAAGVGTVGQPHQVDVMNVGDKLRDRRQRLSAVDRIRFRLHVMQANPRRSGGFE